MKILFINPSLRPDAKRRLLPVGLAYVMTAVKRAGFEFDLIDMDINKLSMQNLERELNDKIYDIYALGCIVTGFRLVKESAEIIKKINPESIIVSGNSVATSIPEIILNHTKVDVAIMGEGDITIVDLLRAIDSGGSISDVNGIAFKDNGRINYTSNRDVVSELDTLGFPDWDIFDLDKYDKYSSINTTGFISDHTVSYPLNGARGCPYQCTFCYHVFKQQKYRKYSEEVIMGEIRRLHYKYNCNHISFWDELSFSNIKSVSAMVDKLGGLGFPVGWEASARGDLFKKEHTGLIRSMKASGCDSITFALENADPDILAAMKKKMSVSQFIEQVKALWDGGVTPLTSVIFGYPQESSESIQATMDVCEECGIFPSVGFLLPLPGTQIYKWAKENGKINDEVEYLERIGDRQDFHINLTAMSDEEFVDTVTVKLEALAEKQGLKLESVFKTLTYQRPNKP